MAAFIGIDLGTTYSSISYIDDNGRPQIIRNSEGQNITPSCILFKDDKAGIVGEVARQELGRPNVLSRFKRDMGTPVKYNVNGKDYTPTDCSALVLKKLVQDAKKEIGEIGETVVTIPANFANEARVETLTAAKQAGLKIENIVDEPTAAALYYAFKGGVELKGNYAVYDLGGGTFDISIIKVKGQSINVVASEGISKLGGDDFDTILQKIVKDKLKKEHGEDLDEQDYTKTDAEEDKKSLSSREELNVRVNRKNLNMTRAEFEQEISSLVAQTEMICESILNETNLTTSDIQDVFLVGGSTRVPMVEATVKRVFGKTPVKSVNVDEAVVLGASLYAAYKGDQSELTPAQKASVNKIKVEDVCPAFFGTLIADHSTGKLVVANIIEKNIPRPCSVTESFETVHDGQEFVECTITSSKVMESDPKFVNIEWKGELSLPSGRPAGQEVKITYSFDDSGIMHASFVDVASGKETKTTLSKIAVSKAESKKIDQFTVE